MVSAILYHSVTHHVLVIEIKLKQGQPQTSNWGEINQKIYKPLILAFENFPLCGSSVYHDKL